MKEFNQIHKTRFFVKGISLAATSVIEILSFIALISRDFNFIVKTDTNQALIGAIFGFSLISTVGIAIMMYRKYTESTESQYGKLLQETELKFQILTTEIEKQKADLLFIIKSKEMTDYAHDYLVELEKKQIYLQREKMEEIRSIIEGFQFGKEKADKEHNK